ncbi:MAG: NAD(P)-dependent oxidoreductase [Candidatus Omnitrophica bacterium]|nr:NAD(P)-dependent oxidoreductase [Candidatus Omnitrophota bacterium]
MKVFVTGASGFVGRELLKKLQESGIAYVAVDLTADAGSGVHVADIRSKDIAALIPEGADAVIHLAGLTRDPDCKNKGRECFDANVMATLNMVDAAGQRNVKQFIFASTEWVYGPFAPGEVKDEATLIDVTTLTSEYALSKFVSEQNLRQKFAHGFCPVTILRFGIIYGTRTGNFSAVEALFKAVKHQDEVSVGSFSTGRCFLHVRDIVDGIIASIGCPGFEIFNLQGDRLVTLKDVLDTAMRITGRAPRLLEKEPGNANVRHVSGARIRRVLGWRPKVVLEDGLRELDKVV